MGMKEELALGFRVLVNSRAAMSGDARARQNGSGERGNKLSEAKI
jgi:hypothetical protein